MPKQKRNKTKYPGVYYIYSDALVDDRREKIFYIMYRIAGKQIEEKAGRQYKDGMTAARANTLRSLRMLGKEPSNREQNDNTGERISDAEEWTIRRLWVEFHRFKEAEGMKSLKDDRSRFKLYLDERFGDRKPGELTVKDVDDLRLEMSKRLKPASVKQTLMLLQRIVNFGYKRQLIPPLHFKIQMPKVNNIKTEDLSPEQLKKLLTVLKENRGDPAADIMYLALCTGMRKGEIFNLQWDDVDFDRGFIHIRDPKGGTDQKIPLNNSARDIIGSQIRGDSPYVFPGRYGGRLYCLKTSFTRIKELAELPEGFRPMHGLRHVYASMLASSGSVDLYTLQKLLTHKSPQMTQRYAHLHDETLKNAASVADEILGVI